MAKTCQANGCSRDVFSHGYCQKHGYMRTDDKYLSKKNEPKKVYTIKKNTKPSGEGLLFQVILSTRRHISFISGLPIENCNHSNCHHVLPKKDYEEFRLLDRNIILVTQSEHMLIHAGTEDQRKKYSKQIFDEHGLIVHWEKLEQLKLLLLDEYKKNNYGK